MMLPTIDFLNSMTSSWLNHQHESGWTALTAATSCAHLKVVELLLSVPGVDVNCLCSKHCEDNEVESTTYLLLSEG